MIWGVCVHRQNISRHSQVHQPCGVLVRHMCEFLDGLQKTLVARRKKYGAHHDRTMECMSTVVAELVVQQR